MSKNLLVCIQNEDGDDLQIRKIYQAIPDSRAEKIGLVRVVDDSEEDYLYPAYYFVPVTSRLDDEDIDDLIALRAAKAEEGDAPTISAKEAAKLWGIEYVDDDEMAEILADTELLRNGN